MPRNRRSSNSKKIDKQMAELRKDFLVVARNKAGEKKSFAAAKFASGLQAEPMMSSILTYLATIIAFGSKNKANVKKMLEQFYPTDDVQPLVEDLEELVEDLRYDALIEGEESDINDLTILINIEPELMKLRSLTEHRLSVAVMNEELKSVVKGVGKVASPKKATKTTGEQLATKLWSFYSSFHKKLGELGVTDDAKRLQFLSSLMDMVPRLKITQNAEGSKSHAK